MLNGRKYSPVGIWAFTKEDFSGWTDEQTADGPKPMLETSSFDFGKRRVGDRFTATFKVRNLGGSALKIYKADPELPAVTPEQGAEDNLSYAASRQSVEEFSFGCDIEDFNEGHHKHYEETD